MTSSDSDRESSALLPSEEHYDAKTIAHASGYEEKTEVIYGEENVVKRALQILPTLNKTLDLSGDRYGPSILLLNEQIKQMYIDLDNRGVGPGIDPSIMPRLFTKFATKSEKGTGLGLFISKSIVEAHGGKIWAKNNS